MRYLLMIFTLSITTLNANGEDQYSIIAGSFSHHLGVQEYVDYETGEVLQYNSVHNRLGFHWENHSMVATVSTLINSYRLRSYEAGFGVKFATSSIGYGVVGGTLIHTGKAYYPEDYPKLIGAPVVGYTFNLDPAGLDLILLGKAATLTFRYKV